MATQSKIFGRFDDGKVIVSVSYDDVTAALITVSAIFNQSTRQIVAIVRDTTPTIIGQQTMNGLGGSPWTVPGSFLVDLTAASSGIIRLTNGELSVGDSS